MLNAPTPIYTCQRLNYESWAREQGISLTSITTDDWQAFMAFAADAQTPRSVLAFPYELRAFRHSLLQGSQSMSTLPIGAFVVFRHPSRRPTGTDRRILTLTPWDDAFVRIVSDVHRIPADYYTLTRLPMNEWGRLSEALAEHDVCITFLVQNSPLHTLLEKQWLMLSGWATEMDVSRLEMVDPSFKALHLDPRTWFSPERGRVGFPVGRPWRVITTQAVVALLGEEASTWPEPPHELFETFVNRSPFSAPEDAESGWKCLGRDDLPTRKACEITNGTMDPSMCVAQKPRYWDKPCETNTDCPFYVQKTGRGGCTSGYCEFPIGVQRVGFRRFEDHAPFQPFCRECDAQSLAQDPDCCKKHGTPDYVFPGETLQGVLK